LEKRGFQPFANMPAKDEGTYIVQGTSQVHVLHCIKHVDP
jgi:hypothetical protein